MKKKTELNKTEKIIKIIINNVYYETLTNIITSNEKEQQLIFKLLLQQPPPRLPLRPTNNFKITTMNNSLGLVASEHKIIR